MNHTGITIKETDTHIQITWGETTLFNIAKNTIDLYEKVSHMTIEDAMFEALYNTPYFFGDLLHQCLTEAHERYQESKGTT